MKALLLTHGTRGDIQPFLALAQALYAAGHQAVLAGPAASAPLASEHSVTYHPVDDGPNSLLGDPELDGVLASGLEGLRGKIEAAKLMRRFKPLMGRVFADMADAADDGADVVVHHPGMPGGHLAEYLGVPSVPALFQPTTVPTSAFPAAGFPAARVPKILNHSTYRILALSVRMFAPVADELRRERLGLPRRPGRHDILRQADGRPSTVLQGFSRYLLPERLGYPPQVHTTGFWFLRSAENELDSRLADFLDTGTPPVFIGFSSTPSRDPERNGRMMVDAVRRVGERAVIASGWGGIDGSGMGGDDVLVIDQAPHDLLFDRCSAIVHHGGGGTTGAALASGRPQIVCPFWGDQPFWARRTHAAGVSPAPVRGQRLTAHSLARAIRATSRPAIRDTAASLGRSARGEEGATEAVTVLENVVRG